MALTVDDVAARVLSLPGVAQVIASEEGGAPEIAWGDRFFFAGADRMRPFATVVTRDVPSFDELSRLDRPGVFRVNVELGRSAFEEVFGFRPAEVPARLAGFDVAAADVLVPHPAYGTRGWASVVAPTAAGLDRLTPLFAAARELSLARLRSGAGQSGR